MKKTTALFLLSIFIYSFAQTQPSFKVSGNIGTAFSPPISYQNCKGHFDPATIISFSFIYQSHPSWNIEMNYSRQKPMAYLKSANDSALKIYTEAQILFEQISVGINYFFSHKKVSPYIGYQLGATCATTYQGSSSRGGLPTPSLIYKFSSLAQTGFEYKATPHTSFRLNAALTTIPHVSNNTPFFNTDRYGAGFPSFIIGNPSTATIIRWSISFGAVFTFPKKKRG